VASPDVLSAGRDERHRDHLKEIAMSDTNNRPNKDGSLRGDSKGLPERGTKTGMNGDSYGASLDKDATNSTSMERQGSDPAGECFNKKSTRL
jgi:hypothetical protein